MFAERFKTHMPAFLARCSNAYDKASLIILNLHNIYYVMQILSALFIYTYKALKRFFFSGSLCVVSVLFYPYSIPILPLFYPYSPSIRGIYPIQDSRKNWQLQRQEICP